MDLPPIEMQFADSGAPVVIVAEHEAATISDALKLAPALGDLQWLRAYARAVNHLTEREDYAPIMDPGTFREKYMSTYEAEDPDEDVGPGTIRLHNFGIPDFAAIHPPQMEGDTLVFFAENMFMGIPYRATMAKGEEPDSQSVAMVE